MPLADLKVDVVHAVPRQRARRCLIRGLSAPCTRQSNARHLDILPHDAICMLQCVVRVIMCTWLDRIRPNLGHLGCSKLCALMLFRSFSLIDYIDVD